MEAIALAGNVIQFTELSVKFVSNCYQFYDNWERAVLKHQELTDVMIHLRTLLGKMTPALHNTEFPELSRIIERCFALIQDLLDLLRRLKVRPPSGKVDHILQGLKFAAKRMVKDEEIKEMEARISRLREAIASHADLLLMGQLEDLGHSLVHNAEKVPDTSPYLSLETKRKNLRVELQTTRNLVEERDLLEAVKIISRLEPTFEPFQKARRIVQSLHFELIRARESDIQDAYENTFRWMFEDRTSHFTEWLRGEHGIYWITGKAGAGKSTLMKYLTGNRRTHNSLQLWSGDGLVIARHHFWSAGTPLQKSQEGLLRTILREILVLRPDLCEKICPQHWHNDTLLGMHSWTIEELLGSLMNLGNLTGESVDKSSGESVEENTQYARTENQSVKICIFIDGLDEYSGDHASLSQLVQKLAGFPNIKLCVSSREWNDFSEAFGNSRWLLRLDLVGLVDRG
ncbi:high-affinity nicotinic acid transporter [Colletotrichum sojae]|uniref:High-affinity nicotinic acid transporter n=1 Tax=Colletotrichum sojae TaxID=2175907 RepID=A0A8H6MIV3_9PEZI|nr:high-affinity nicotinic acid transporter [Colletotrichum sojae]